ncbi:hypothetical protein [Aquabacterium sp.]|uniref:hypothetical protein n=1 Tax=Aquabacterium sp. TaxID=1872578 RepID=UPI002B52F620|nr:hypothetical protein [Aquabacterium sp.]HSW07637.1 hypothetical protein [Aquabacterium sp.]
MRHVAATVLSALALTLSNQHVCAAESPPPRKNVGRLQEMSVERLQAFLKIYVHLLYGKDVVCASNPCPIDVPVTVIQFDVNQDGNLVDYCLAEFPKDIYFSGTASGNPRRRIVWRMTPSTFTGTSGITYRFEFHEDYGILLATNPSGQITRGGQGDGVGSTDPWMYHMRNWHRAKVTAVYLPVVTHINTADASEMGVCATGDPRIVNN